MSDLESLKRPVDLSPEELLSRKSLLVEAVRNILFSVGEDPDREGLAQTPQRIAQGRADALPRRSGAIA